MYSARNKTQSGMREINANTPKVQNCVLVALQWRLKMPPRSVMSPPAPDPVPSRMSSKVPAGEGGGRARGQRGDKHPSALSTRTTHTASERPKDRSHSHFARSSRICARPWSSGRDAPESFRTCHLQTNNALSSCGKHTHNGQRSNGVA